MDFRKIEFIKSGASQSDFIRDGRPQIVFAGRSNVGKSSVINKLVQRKNFARVGSAPGKTVHINYFLADNKAYLVDLPGYGYSKVSKAEKKRWGQLIESYFSESGLITLGVMIVDLRHKPTADDIIMAKWFIDTGCPLIVVANKSDKVKKSELDNNLKLIAETLMLPAETALIPFSAQTGANRDILISEIERRL